METTKKNLKELAKCMGAYYMGGNVYNYENIIYYLTHKDTYKLIESESKYNELEKLNNDLDLLIGYINIDNYYVSDRQIAYSHGLYGNNGQLHKISIYNKDNEIIKDIFVYYC